MPAGIATLIFAAGILGLFWLDRDLKSRTSSALWISIVWFFLACSRSAGRWLGMAPNEAATAIEDGSPLDRVLFGVLLLAGLGVLASRSPRVIRILRHCGPVVLFFGYCLVSLLWSDFPALAFKHWNKSIGDWVMILIVWTDPQPIVALKRLQNCITFTLIPLSILFIKYYSDIGRSYGRWVGEVHYLGVTTDKNTLGAICLLFGLGSVWRLLELPASRSRDGKRRMLAHASIIVMIVWLFSFIDAMTSTICFGLGSCLLMLMRLRFIRKVRALIHLAAVGMIALTASIAFLGLSPGSLQAVGRNSTLTERTDIWAGVLRLSQNPLIGTGYESFWLGPRLDAMVRDVTRWWVPNEAHNGYLEIYANLGWVGIACLSVVLVWGYRRLFRAWCYTIVSADLMLAYFIAGIIFNFTEAAFFRMMVPVWIFLLLALSFPRFLSDAASTDERARHRLSGSEHWQPPTGDSPLVVLQRA